MSLSGFLLASLMTLTTAFGQSSARPQRDYTKFNVCAVVSGDAVARAVGAKLTEARPVFDALWSRCVFRVVGADGKPNGHVVWMQPAEDFEDLKKYIEEPRTELSGLGDAAYIFRDKGDGRFKINVLKRNDLTFQVTGDSAESARKVADVVVAALWKKNP